MATTEPFDLAVVDQLLSTTRAVRRRLDLDRPVERDVLLECIALSQQAPTASDSQTWRWVVVTDPELRAAVGEIYGRARDMLVAQRDASEGQTRRVYSSAVWLAEHMAEVPAHVIPCVVGRPPAEFSAGMCSAVYGSIMPAVWSFQLALRSRGLGSTLTTVHLFHEADMASLLGIPEDVLQVALLPVAYTQGTDFRVADRPPVESITSFDGWRW